MGGSRTLLRKMNYGKGHERLKPGIPGRHLLHKHEVDGVLHATKGWRMRRVDAT